MKKVLVIEDNPDNMRLITYALERKGYAVVPAMTGEDGLEYTAKEDFLFIIVDIALPGIDGVETTKRLRDAERTATMPIVAITSFAMAGDAGRILDAGCNACFEKPIDPLTIVDKIQKAIGIG
jgi:two-component system cell cycle response regulator DivK